jgi:hypothetical protein
VSIAARLLLVLLLEAYSCPCGEGDCIADPHTPPPPPRSAGSRLVLAQALRVAAADPSPMKVGMAHMYIVGAAHVQVSKANVRQASSSH